MQNRHIQSYLTALLFLAPGFFFAQSFAKLVENADRLTLEGKFAAAAELYETAARLKSDDPATMVLAAESYVRVRDYAKAVECYTFAKGQFDNRELASLRYARALKQSGQYAAARQAFVQCSKQYKGALKASLPDIIRNEISGCDMAANLLAQPDTSLIINLLPDSINQIGNEFAPLFYGNNLLYFSIPKVDRVHLQRTVRTQTGWLAAEEATGLPESVLAQYGSGAFSPDGNRFYCTQCEAANAAERAGNSPPSQCQLYVLRHMSDGWSEPERLRAYINMPGVTVTHPFVCQEQGRERLFFASNRPDGLGGLDLYVCERPLSADVFDFSFPQNLGPDVNSIGDDITPCYNTATHTLWFSTNARPTLGGFDIFKCQWENGQWSAVQNAGAPLNSPADDYFFTLKNDQTGGVFVSNRLWGTQKRTTRHQDIFEFVTKGER